MTDFKGKIGAKDAVQMRKLFFCRYLLTETEKLFAEAWLSSDLEKERKGDELKWDAEGFQPPDSTKH